MAKVRRKKALPVIGWREWVALPDLGLDAIKAKIDTGARSSALHAFDLRAFTVDGVPWVRFRVHPMQHGGPTIETEAEVVEMRRVTNPGGRRELRPVIRTDVVLMGQRWEIDLTLTPRWGMGFRMLLGRQAVRRRFLIDAGRSFFGEREEIELRVAVGDGMGRSTETRAKRKPRKKKRKKTLETGEPERRSGGGRRKKKRRAAAPSEATGDNDRGRKKKKKKKKNKQKKPANPSAPRKRKP